MGGFFISGDGLMPDEIVIPVVPPQNAGPETFSREYVTELRAESQSHRLRVREQEAKVSAAEAKAAAAATEADAKVATAAQGANDRILRAELKAVALAAGMVDLDGLKLADLTTVKLNDAGEVEGAEALMAAMKIAKPYLFGSTQSSSTAATAPSPKTPVAKKASEMTPEEYAIARRQFK